MNKPADKYEAFLNTAVRATRASGKIQREKLYDSHDIRHKGESDLVTEVDVACEEKIKSIIAEDWPDHAVLGEEQGATGEGDYLWIVDPLDGTTNYTHAYPHFNTSIGIEEKKIIVAGAVYDPMRDEMFTATLGGGAFLNDEPIHVSDLAVLDQCMLATGFPYDRERREKAAVPLFTAIQGQVHAVRRDGSAALNLCYLAAGRFDGFWELFLNPWDVAAGWIIVTEAGGKISGFDGNPTTVYSEQIVATNDLIHDRLLASLAAVNIKI